MTSPKGILSCVGNTPLIELEKYFPNAPFSLFAKMESLNPGGSLKDRPALKMLLESLNSGEINLDTTIIESSSGNTGVGLAQACAYLGLRFICVTDLRSTMINRRIIKAYGATIDLVEKPDPENGFLGARLTRVRQLLDTIPNSFNCDQYRNLNNPRAHYQTLQEILDALNGDLDYVFVATSTCGTLRGFSEYVKQLGTKTQVIGVDAIGSVIFGDKPKKRLIPGHGAAVSPPHYQPGLEDDFILVSDLDCIVACRRLVRREGIFSGGSSGAVIAGIEKMKTSIPPGSRVVAIINDHGSRYLNNVYSDAWVAEHFGEVSHLWENSSGALQNELG